MLKFRQDYILFTFCVIDEASIIILENRIKKTKLSLQYEKHDVFTSRS